VPDFQEPTYGQTPLQLATRLIAFDLPQATDILVDLVSAAPNCNLVTWEAVPGQALILKLTGIFIGSPLDSAIGMYEKLEYISSRSVLPLKIQQSELFLTCATCFPAIGARVPRHGFSAVLADHRDKLNLMIQFSFSDEAEMWMDLKDQVDCVDRFLNNALLAQTFIENNPSLDVTQPTLYAWMSKLRTPAEFCRALEDLACAVHFPVWDEGAPASVDELQDAVARLNIDS